VRLGLANAIDVVRKRIQQIRDRKEIIGEQNTKAALIDPLLVALGWDLQEIDEIRREYRRKPQDNPVDYALFLNRTESLFIEAKSLEKDLNDRKWISQNLSYATVVGVRWCVLTNGDEYRIYNSHAAKHTTRFRPPRVWPGSLLSGPRRAGRIRKQMAGSSGCTPMMVAHWSRSTVSDRIIWHRKNGK
jgi:type I site-specific restriction endonuclease